MNHCGFMDCTVNREGNTIILSASGRMDGFGSQKVDEALRSQLIETDTAVVVDMAAVDFMSSAGLRFFQSL